MVVKKTGEQKYGDYRSFIKEGAGPDLPTHLNTEKASLALFVTANTLGKGNEDHGELLTKSFFYALNHNDQLPRFIIFINTGVFLSCEGSAVLQVLIDLEKQGVGIYTSGACLDHYQIKHKLCVGVISNMYTIMEKLSMVEKVLTI